MDFYFQRFSLNQIHSSTCSKQQFYWSICSQQKQQYEQHFISSCTLHNMKKDIKKYKKHFCVYDGGANILNLMMECLSGCTH
jgi:hypothetical protein